MPKSSAPSSLNTLIHLLLHNHFSTRYHHLLPQWLGESLSWIFTLPAPVKAPSFPRICSSCSTEREHLTKIKPCHTLSKPLRRILLHLEYTSMTHTRYLVLGCLSDVFYLPCPLLLLLQPHWLPQCPSNRPSLILPGYLHWLFLQPEWGSLPSLFPRFIQISSQMTTLQKKSCLTTILKI